jgi:DNA-binding MarR family transcriptional regulator
VNYPRPRSPEAATARDHVVDTLANGEASLTELAASTTCRRGSVESALRVLKNRGWVEKGPVDPTNKRGVRWRLTT